MLAAWAGIRRLSQGAMELLGDIFRLRELMICPAMGTTRLKEIMSLPEAFISWAEKVMPPLFFGSRVAAFDL